MYTVHTAMLDEVPSSNGTLLLLNLSVRDAAATLRPMPLYLSTKSSSESFRQDIFDACHILLTILTALLTFFGNTLMVVVIIRTKSLHIPQTYMLLSIAVADFILGLESLMGFLSFIVDSWTNSSTGCLIMGYITNVATTANIFTLALLSIDRWLVIHKPFIYDTMMPTKRVIVINIVLWLVSILFYTPFLFTELQYDYLNDIHICVLVYSDTSIMLVIVMSLSRLPSLLIIIIFTILTCRTAHIHAQQIHALETQTGRLNNGCQGNNNQGDQLPGIHRSASNSQSTRSRKHIRTTLIIILTNTLTWLPLYLAELTMTINPGLLVPDILLFVVSWLLVSSSYVNWIICLATDTNFYQATKKLFRDMGNSSCKSCCCCCCQSSTYRSERASQSQSQVSSHSYSEESRY